MLRRLKRETLRERIVDEVKRAIIEGDLKPGDRLPTEMELAESLGVSRSSVREATKALEFIGVLNSSPKNGCTVGNFDLRSVVEQLRFHLEVRRATLKELLDARLLLEVGVIPMAVKCASDEELAALQKHVDGMRGAHGRGETGIEDDLAFHSGIFQAAQNRVLESFQDLIKEFFIQMRKELLSLDEEVDASIHQHQEVLDALRARNVEGAQAAMTHHLEAVRQQIGNGYFRM